MLLIAAVLRCAAILNAGTKQGLLYIFPLK